MTTTAALYQFAHGRTGDKGDRSNISVIAYDARDYDHLVAHVTEAAVRDLMWRKAAVFRDRDGLAAHVWVSLCDIPLIGGEEAGEFAAVGTFP